MSRCEVGEDGTVRYFNSSNKLHREDGPAVEDANGNKAWYINGKLHREDGPALECANGNKLWFINDTCHREDGPAVEWDDGSKSWSINGIFIRHSTTNHFVKLSQLSLRCFSFELFEYREIEDLVSEGLGVNQYSNCHKIVEVVNE